ncbi:MAG TPA: hypothetical protein VJS92_08150 [Candidatus Polarisedimenticolaceae bacterium]|nr:hypothetical protein [Candidatus Polarisedimenticolaceae bacterium]
MRRLATLGLTFALAAAPAAAWAPETRVRMVDEAIRLMPASLRLVLERQREQVRRGMLLPLTDEDAAAHKPASSGGTLPGQLEEETRQLAAALARGTEFRDIAERLGRVAHFVADAGFPPGASAQGSPRYRHFAGFCESRREKFPLVFYGHDDADLARGDVRAFVTHVAARAAQEDTHLARAYAAAGSPPDPAAFDDRSVPFAVGSLCYSRSINDMVRLWLWAWRQAGGDAGRTPYAKARP